MRKLTLGLTLREVGSLLRGKIVDLVCGTELSCSDYMVCEGVVTPPISTIIEDEPFDIVVGSFANDSGYSSGLGMGSLPIRVEIDGHLLTTLYVDHANRLIFMEFEGYLGAFNASSLDITLGGTGQLVTLNWDTGLKLYVVESVAATNYFNVNDDDKLGFIIHKPVTTSIFNGVPDPDNALGKAGDKYVQYVAATTAQTSILKTSSYHSMDNGYDTVTLHSASPWFQINKRNGELQFVAASGSNVVVADNSKLTLGGVGPMDITVDTETPSKVTGHVESSFLPAIQALTGHVAFEITVDAISGGSEVNWIKDNTNKWVKD